MRYIADHDFHIHTTLSPCCHDEDQTARRLLRYGEENGFSKICITNHLWDEKVKSVGEWHPDQRYKKIKRILPLPQSEKTLLLFGAEIDMDYNCTLGVSPERYDEFDFMVVSTTHLHLKGYTVEQPIRTPKEASEKWLGRIYALLEKDMPWHKVGIAHLTCGHIMAGRTPEVIKLLSDDILYDVFGNCAQKGIGIELNIKSLSMTEEERNILLRPYHIAKDCGCKFYLGSDSHKTSALENSKAEFENIITLLSLEEKDKFRI